MKALYFAWVRERVGKAEEELSPPVTVATVGDLIAWLAKQGEGYAYAFEKPAAVRAALDRVHARSDAANSRREGSRVLSPDDRRLAPMATIRVQRAISTPARRPNFWPAGGRTLARW